MALLFETIHYDDFSTSFSRNENDKSLDKAYASFNKVLETFRNARQKSEDYRHFLQAIVQHVGIPILAFDNNGNVEIMNTVAKKYLNINRLKNLQELPANLFELRKIFHSIKNKQKEKIKIVTNQEVMMLSVFASEFVVDGKMIKLVTMVNISRELDEKELESWLSLLKVLTHEIMNSMTPISSLSSSVNELLSEQFTLNNETLPQIKPAMATIEKRSKGLVEFLSAFRSLTSAPRPQFEYLYLKDIVADVIQFFDHIFKQKVIICNINIEPSTIAIMGDKSLIMQVIINVIQNSLEALQGIENPSINIKCYLSSEGRIFIIVEDNGKGILPDVQEKIFIPFFTTKKNGSGIGLSLSRLILQTHRANINVESSVDECFTRVIIVF